MSITIPSDFPSKPSAKQPKFDIPAPASEMHEKGSGYAKVEGDNTSHKIKVGADDLGSLTIGGATAEVTRKGPQGGGKFEYSEEKEVVLTSGFHKASWSFDNIDYKPASGNVAKFEALLDDKQVELMDLKGVQFLPLKDAPGGFEEKESQAKSYIGSGAIEGMSPYKIYTGILFGDTLNPSKKVKPTFIAEAAAPVEFNPSEPTADGDGFAKFLLKTTSPTKNLQVKVDDETSPVQPALPALFKDKFTCTVYFTVDVRSYDHKNLMSITPLYKNGSTWVAVSDPIQIPTNLYNERNMEGTFYLSEDRYPNMPHGRYLAYSENSWHLRNTAVGQAEIPLVDKSSCAGFYNRNTKGSQFKRKSQVRLIDPSGEVIKAFGNDTWTVVDTGAPDYVPQNHLDLYWGVDRKGPGGNPASLPGGFKQGDITVELISVP